MNWFVKAFHGGTRVIWEAETTDAHKALSKRALEVGHRRNIVYKKTDIEY